MYSTYIHYLSNVVNPAARIGYDVDKLADDNITHAPWVLVSCPEGLYLIDVF
jgi:hypothetical protein